MRFFMEALPPNSLGIALLPGSSALLAALCFAGSGWKCPPLDENVTCGCNPGSAASALSLPLPSEAPGSPSLSCFSGCHPRQSHHRGSE